MLAVMTLNGSASPIIAKYVATVSVIPYAANRSGMISRC